MRFIKCFFIIGALLFACNSFAKNPESPSNQQIVEQFLSGFENPDQIEKSFALLSEDYTFQNPLIKLNSKAEFIPLAHQIAQVLNGVNVLNIAGHGNWVAVLYEFTSEIPGVESNIATEWFRIEDGLIMESQLIYDASEWRKVYEQK